MATLLPVYLPAEEAAAVDHPRLEEYLILNEQEERLAEYADDKAMLNLKLYQLDLINESRRRAGVGPVELDILACRTANRMAREAAAEGFMGHWNTRGEKPYHRWAFAGGRDHVMENAAARWSSAPLPGGPEAIETYMREAHIAFMNELPPNDGHRQNCVDPLHTHVGLGVALQGQEFRYYEEFLDRYLDFAEAPSRAAVSEEFILHVRPLEEAYNIYALVAFYEDYPRPMTVQMINRRGSYPDYTDSRVLALWPWDLQPMRDQESRWSAIPLNFTRPGLYYVHIYLTRGELPRSGSVSTRGKIQASGYVVEVK
ncbi:MAG: CAP domain-containing protein [Spirochaetales bacterium]|nr:CAP domain-containing protein [Spirochaetales bacterium]